MKKIILLLGTLELTGCAGHQYAEKPPTTLIDHGDYTVDMSYPSQSQDDRVRFLIFHYTAVDDNESLRLLAHGSASAHYLIPSNPTEICGKPVVLQLVPENKLAWHAGVSVNVSGWSGYNNINDASIGIEIVNDGFHEGPTGKQWIPYHKEQTMLAARLARDIIARYQIKSQNMLAHSDIAPFRKTDPGPQFPWREVAQQEGHGRMRRQWTNICRANIAGPRANITLIKQALVAYSYTIPQTGTLDKLAVALSRCTSAPEYTQVLAFSAPQDRAMVASGVAPRFRRRLLAPRR
ncbi:N-acetylmuramoyl-L-alanine amidase [Sodalis-like endosymbiont of Proechinophthirus fluctus]|uniref:N-acetylmuramoyl-L-alanine amidase n=1 Tax=Sodalis-like endosymbiont of Proechinophthirus fluctus TaxID=1462730 RepID=UPI000B23BB16|nr:N-acetylmuramoyl-L-alanine amidase [Sodalis-like endosymbiont of Proechinophthirus fluctus]